MAEETEADRVRRAYNERIADIRSRNDLSDDGRRRQLAAAKVETDQKMRLLRERQEQAVTERRNTLVRQLFGRPGTVDGAAALSVRDALTRVEQIHKPEDAESLLRLARTSGDPVLAQALAARSYELIRNATMTPAGRERWGQVLAEWADGDPDTDQALAELLDIDHIGRSRSQTLTSMMIDRMRTSAHTPTELARANVTELARQADARPDEDEAPDPGAWFQFRRPLGR